MYPGGWILLYHDNTSLVLIIKPVALAEADFRAV